MPAHIGFLETFKMGLNALTTNISPSSTSRRARSALANQRQNLRGQAQGLAVGVPDPVQQFGDSLLSLSDVQNRLERNRSGREHRCDFMKPIAAIWITAHPTWSGTATPRFMPTTSANQNGICI